MNEYIEHDRRNHSIRTLSESDVLMHYGASVVSTLWRDGSIALSKGIDIYINDSYTLSSTINQVSDRLCDVKPVIKFSQSMK